MGKWITPASMPTGVACWRVTLPDDDYLYACFLGAMLQLSYPNSWQQSEGGASPEDTAALFVDAFETVRVPQVCGGGFMLPIGAVFPWAGGPNPGGTLVCAGQTLLIEDYPDLHDVIGYTFGGVSGVSFNLPDMRDRFVVGSGSSYVQASTGGSDKVGITMANLPITLLTQDYAPGYVQRLRHLGTEEPEPVDTVPPYVALLWVIVYENSNTG